MKWISVKDRLPKDSRVVFIYGDKHPVEACDDRYPHVKDYCHKGFDMAVYHARYEGTAFGGKPYVIEAHWELSNCCNYGTPHPTHWMELKDLPRPK